MYLIICLIRILIYIYYLCNTRISGGYMRLLLIQLWTFSLCIHCKIETNKMFADFIKQNNLGFLKFNEKLFLWEANFWSFDHPCHVMWWCAGPTQNLGPIDSAVLTEMLSIYIHFDLLLNKSYNFMDMLIRKAVSRWA